MSRWLVMVGLLAFAGVASAGESTEAAYAPCAACHLPNGEGVPGAFPPIRNRTAVIAGLEGGREYLITVALHGLMGMITVDGQVYAGVMAGHKGILDAETIAAALNHSVLVLSDEDHSGKFEPFSAEEVEAVDAGTSQGLGIAGQLRSTLVEKHAEQWPQ